MKISLNDHATAKVDFSQYTVTDDGLIIDITSKYDLSHATVTFKNNYTVKKLNYTRNIRVPRELLFAGRLYIVVELYNGAKLLKKWQVEPINIYERETTFELEPWVLEMDRRLSAVEENQKILL